MNSKCCIDRLSLPVDDLSEGSRLREEKDMAMMGLLKPIGIEKGVPYAPDSRRKEILDAAADVHSRLAPTFVHVHDHVS